MFYLIFSWFQDLERLRGRSGSRTGQRAVWGRGQTVRSQDHGGLQQVQALLARCPQSHRRHAEEETFFHCWSSLPCGRSYRELSSFPVGHQPRQLGACFFSSLVRRAPSVSASMAHLCSVCLSLLKSLAIRSCVETKWGWQVNPLGPSWSGVWMQP